VELNPTFKDRITPTKWDTPEKAVAGLLAIGGIVAGIFFWSTIVTWVIALLANTLLAIGLMVLLGAVITILINPKFRTAMSYGFQMLLRGIAGIIVNTNKIEVMFIRLDRAKKDLEKYDVQIGRLEGQKVDQDTKLNTQKKLLIGHQEKAEFAKKQLNSLNSIPQERLTAEQRLQITEWQSQYDLALIAITGATDLRDTYQTGSNDLAKALTFFKNLRSAMDFAIRKSEIELNTIKAKYENIRAMHSTISTAMKIIKGNPDDNYMFELAMQKTNEEMTQKLGDIKIATESAKDFINSYNMEKGIMLERGQKILDQNKNLSILRDYDENQSGKSAVIGPSISSNISQPAKIQTTNLLD